MLKKYNVSIEQPMVFSIEVEAETIEQAEAKAIEQWNKYPITTDENWDYGTDAQIMTEGTELNEADEPLEVTDWHNFF